ncbi:hypothetical protein K4K96_00840 [Phaeobacter inhibens]|uniref:hypothetical protein n=1 Tax=Phaeobacter inhibens TaxID=221822 RepID=UPI0021A927C8|nr:hypothetical protein [Phaeobacter inhibens]UWR92640.1 hypothetical protein K4K96_00840 [Phaeobacter inhibens]
MADIGTQIKQTRQKLRVLQAKAQKLRREDDKRLKVLYGVASLALLKDLPDDKRQSTLDRLHSKIIRENDREFLGLPPLDE